MRIALAQLDCTPGDVEDNARRVRDALHEAQASGADLVVFPELHLSGYSLRGVGGETGRTTEELAALVEVPDGVSAVIGFHERDGSSGYNSAAYLQHGAAVHVHRKLYLVHYAPFGEAALFSAGDELRAFDTAHGRMAVLICNDAWHPFLPPLAVEDGARILLVPSASSTVVPEAEAYWRDMTRFYAQMLECYVVFVNRVGAEPGFTFWGGSHVVDPHGVVAAEAPRFEEALLFADVELDRVEARRRALPLLADPRLDLLKRELTRLSER